MKNRIVFLLIGAGLLWASWMAGKGDLASRNWKPVQGQVVFSKIVKQAGGWEPVVRYQYSVDGKTYESGYDRFDGGWATVDAGAADMVVSDHRKGSKVTVYYDPANPAAAALEVGISGRNAIFTLLGLGFLAIGIFVKGPSSAASPQAASAAAGSNS